MSSEKNTHFEQKQRNEESENVLCLIIYSLLGISKGSVYLMK